MHYEPGRLLFFGSLSIVGVGFVKIPPQFYEKGPFYVQFQVLLILGREYPKDCVNL